MNKYFPCPVTTIFARRIKPGFEKQYEEWLTGVTETSSKFKGSQGTTLIRPSTKNQEYIAIVQFASAKNLETWMNSNERLEWLNKLDPISLDSQEISTLTGMERWFTLPNRPVSQAPSKYKSAILVFLGLYPLVIVLNIVLVSLVESWNNYLQIFVSLLISVPLMVWVILPLLTRLFFGWMYPEPK